MFLLAAGVGGLLTGCGGSAKTTTTTVKRAPAAGVSVSKLTSLSASLGHPIFWAGAERGHTYELSRTKDGRVFIRYLPRGAKVGDPKPNYLSVGTYPQANAFAVLKATAKKQGVPTISLRGGGRAFVDKDAPDQCLSRVSRLRLPDVEVYDPSPARARRLVVSGRESRLGSPLPVIPAPEQQRLLRSRRSPRRWGTRSCGPDRRRPTTYELTQTTDGRIYIRYLPAGVKVGDQEPDDPTVGTYPQTNALAALKTAAAKSNAETIELAGGAVASIDKTRPDERVPGASR